MGSYLRLLLLVADWPLAHRLPTITNSLVHLVSGTPRYEMIIYNQAHPFTNDSVMLNLISFVFLIVLQLFW